MKGKSENKEKENSDLKKQIASKDNEIKGLKVQITSKDNEINGLKGQITNKDNEITGLKGQLENKEKEINALREEFNKMKGDNENKIKEQSDEISKLKSEIENNDKNKKLTEENTKIKEEIEKLKKIIMPLTSDKSTFDISLNFSSIKSIKEGWNLNFSEQGLNNFTTSIKCRKIGVLGNKRVGKSFIISNIFGLPYSSKPIITNEKINIKFKPKKGKKKDKNELELIFFDSDGLNCPILEQNNNYENIKINNNEEKKKKQKKRKKIKILKVKL